MPDSSAVDRRNDQAEKAAERETIPDTLISIMIALILAFVFRGFVVEAFVIPTGSMAPTLMGKHMRMASDETGYTWQVGPWSYVDRETPLGRQGSADEPIEVHDPMSGKLMTLTNAPLLSGDRILVLKFLYSLFPPDPFDVVVFKNPTNPTQNYIKRLIGLPGETIALVDGDVWVYEGPPEGEARDSWSRDGWQIRRKPVRVQRSVWQPIHDSSYATPQEQFSSKSNVPWTSDERGWDTSERVYEYDGSGGTRLDFRPIGRTSRRGPMIALHDRYAYDEGPRGQRDIFFNVSDVRLSAGIEPVSELERVTASVETRNHIMEAAIGGGRATLSVRPDGDSAGISNPINVSKTFEGWRLEPGRVTNVDFWHVDQRLMLWIDGELVGELAYDDWTPADRFANAADQSLERALAGGRGVQANPLASNTMYKPARIGWGFTGPVRMHRVRVGRDLYYRPAAYPRDRLSPYDGDPALATHPEKNAILGEDQFFVLGDNSPQSLDGRLWGDPNPWVTEEFEAAGEGVVPRDLLLGKAFFVYFPSLHKDTSLPVPDAGRLRFIH